MSNANECAYPCIPTDRSGQAGPMEYGLSKREIFAMQIAQGLVATPGLGEGVVVSTSIRLADALLAELARTGG